MSPIGAQRARVVAALAAVLAVTAASSAAGQPVARERTPAAAPPRQVELRGRVVCLAEEMHRLHQADLPTDHAHLWGFRATDGQHYTLLRTKLSEGLFVDDALRRKELILKGRLFPDSSVFEMTTVRSVKDGVVYDVFYWCDICAIKTLKPGECMCCQAPVVLKEQQVGNPTE
jgi:hypothetical protein